MTWTQWIAKRLFGASSPKDVPEEIPDITGQTQRFTRTLFVIALVGLVALLIAAGPLEGEIRFVVWALMAALASAVVGAALGLLFGLPTVEAKREALASTKAAVMPNISPGNASPPPPPMPPVEKEGSSPPQEPQKVVTRGEEVELGYRDSTSLEQIADWLTKIIVGLTLTQYATWEDRFQILASNVTAAMMGAPPRDPMCARIIGQLRGEDLIRALDLPACRASPIPGGVLIALFATAGFLICYLWMRRYFILEMVIAKREALNKLREESIVSLQRAETERRKVEEKAAHDQLAAEQNKIIEAARRSDLAEANRNRPTISNPQAQLDHIFSRAEKRLVPGSPGQKKLAEIRRKFARGRTYPDDPWREKFGTEASGGFRLEASVSAIADNPQFFKVELLVHAERPGLAAEAAGSRVMYFLHPTFPDQPKISNFGSDGSAPLEVFAYGAFTVGALLPENGVTLELNLATLDRTPERFLSQ